MPCRARCSAALEDPEAFKPRSRLRAPYQAGAGPEGRPLLPAALAAERMVEEMLGWAAQVPPFATHLTGEQTVAQGLGGGRVGTWVQLRLASLGVGAGRRCCYHDWLCGSCFGSQTFARSGLSRPAALPCPALPARCGGERAWPGGRRV